ncbi:MAG: hypothetical protein JXA28_13580 [Bacteroidetes bacterium]|nr:hypothetical protein [Bacteroidota bacterium]
MKLMTLGIVCALLSTIPLAASQGHTKLPETRQQILKQNILRNLEHRIPDIRTNTLQLLIDLSMTHPEFDLDFALIPVMHILKNDKREGLRILAAVALFHIGGARGHFAVHRRGLYDDSPRVARNCRRLALHWGETVALRSIGAPADYSVRLAQAEHIKKIKY